MKRIVITKRKDKILSCFFEDNILIKVRCEDCQKSMVGNIYLGRVQSVVKNIDAAFVEIQKGIKCYLPLEGRNIKEGEELFVQVVRDRIKTKEAVVSTNLSFAGRYAVITTENKRVGFSSKMDKEKKKVLKEICSPYLDENLGYVIRTNAGELTSENFGILTKELSLLTQTCKKILSVAKTRTLFSCLYETLPEYALQIRDADLTCVDAITTDILEFYEYLCDYFKRDSSLSMFFDKLKLYEDTSYSLNNLIRLEKQLADALQPKVWLNCGGYLVIEQTEALTVVDVNSGKFDGKKHMEESFLKINLEASEMIARQLRLRNVSGIIIIDFINMEKAENKKKVVEALKKACKSDEIKTTIVGLTALGLMEVTRKRVFPPLKEQLGE